MTCVAKRLPLLLCTILLADCSGSSQSDGGPGEGRGSFPLCIIGWWHTYSYAGTCSGSPQCVQPSGEAATVCAASDCEYFSWQGFTLEDSDGGTGWQGYAGGGALWSAKARAFLPDPAITQAIWEAVPPDQITVIDSIGQQTEDQGDCAPGELTLGNSSGAQQQYYSFQDSALVAALNAHGAEGPWTAISY